MVLGLFTGRVTSFDRDVGMGEVTTADGRVFPFHCTAISDGSRTIDCGEPVAFALVAGGPGRWEARPVAKLSPHP